MLMCTLDFGNGTGIPMHFTSPYHHYLVLKPNTRMYCLYVASELISNVAQWYLENILLIRSLSDINLLKQGVSVES